MVSVIVPIYNGEADLPDLVQCLRQQTYPPERVEYCFVDNQSNDRTWDMLQSYRLESGLLQYQPLQETAIQSSYAARNTGIRAATGKILAFTDADCRPLPNWLEHLVQPFRQVAIGIVAGEIVALPGTSLLERYAARHHTLSQQHALNHPFRPYGQTANLAIRRTVLQQTGLFRPYLSTGGDADLCWRVLGCGGWQLAFANQAIVQHRHRSTLTALYHQWRRYGCSNQYLHELHGVSLMPAMTHREYLHRWGRWLLKEIPMALLHHTRFQNDRSDCSALVDAWLDTPLELLCRHARLQGQQQANLPTAAQEIALWNFEAGDCPVKRVD